MAHVTCCGCGKGHRLAAYSFDGQRWNVGAFATDGQVCCTSHEGTFDTAEEATVQAWADWVIACRDANTTACESCRRPPAAVNHMPGCIFVGWGHGWQTCSACGGKEYKPFPAQASLSADLWTTFGDFHARPDCMSHTDVANALLEFLDRHPAEKS